MDLPVFLGNAILAIVSPVLLLLLLLILIPVIVFYGIRAAADFLFREAVFPLARPPLSRILRLYCRRRPLLTPCSLVRLGENSASLRIVAFHLSGIVVCEAVGYASYDTGFHFDPGTVSSSIRPWGEMSHDMALPAVYSLVARPSLRGIAAGAPAFFHGDVEWRHPAQRDAVLGALLGLPLLRSVIENGEICSGIPVGTAPRSKNNPRRRI